MDHGPIAYGPMDHNGVVSPTCHHLQQTSQAENDAMHAAAGAEDDDAVAFRRQQGRRKQKATEYLENKLATFTLLVSLTLALVLSCVNHILFKLVNSDRRNLGGQEDFRSHQFLKQQAKRIRTKGPESFLTAEDQEKQLRFFTVKDRAATAIRRFWKELLSDQEHLFSVASAFWPRDELVYNKYKIIRENILRNIVSLKWRVCARFCCAPWSFCDFERCSFTDDMATCPSKQPHHSFSFPVSYSVKFWQCRDC